MKTAIAALSAGLLLAAPLAQAQKPVEWRLQSPFAQTAPPYRYLERMRDDIAKRTDGQVVIKLFPHFGLGYKNEDPLIAVRDGLLEAAQDNLNAYTGVIPIMAVGNLPFLFDDDKEHLAGLKAIRGRYDKALEKHNARLIWLSALPLTYLFAREPVLKAEAFRGMKIRVAAKPVMAAIAKLGAAPQTIALAEAIAAMQTGVIDGQIWSIEAGISFKIYDVVHHASSWPFYGVEEAIYVNKQKFDQLSPKLQKAVLAAARENEEAFNRDILLGDEDARKKMEATGKMKFHFPEKAEIAKARAGSREIWDNWVKQTGPAGADALKTIEAALGR